MKKAPSSSILIYNITTENEHPIAHEIASISHAEAGVLYLWRDIIKELKLEPNTIHDEAEMKKLFALAQNESLPVRDRIILMSTFDMAVFSRNHIKPLSRVFKQYGMDNPESRFWAIGKFLSDALKWYDEKYDIQQFCISWNSNNDLYKAIRIDNDSSSVSCENIETVNCERKLWSVENSPYEKLFHLTR